MSLSRRALLGGALCAVSVPAAGQSIAGMVGLAYRPRSVGDVVREGLERYGRSLRLRDVVGIADFSAPSRLARFWIVDVASGRATSHLVSHGRGSDPGHRGWVERFSNEVGSEASSSGGTAPQTTTVAVMGRRSGLSGLSPTNSNAEARAIVIHGAWYVSPEMVRQHGKLGRSEGCFAFDEKGSLGEVLSRLGRAACSMPDASGSAPDWLIPANPAPR